MSLNPYLYFNGQCEEAFHFYEKCLDGKITFMMRWEGSPMAGQAPPGWARKILHAALASGDGVLEGCDAMPGQYKKPESFCVMLRPKDASEADRIFKALADGGTVQIPIEETFWALRFGQVVDRFGVPWLVNCEKPAVGERRLVVNRAAAEFQQLLGVRRSTDERHAGAGPARRGSEQTSRNRFLRASR